MTAALSRSRVTISAALLLAAGAVAFARRPRPARHAPRRTSASRPAAPEPAPAWSAAFDLRAGAADLPGRPDAVVHAPRGFDATLPLHLVIVLHGAGHSALTWAGGGLPDPRTGRPVVGWGGEVRHDLAATRTLFVALQFETRPGRPYLGRLAARGGLRRLLDELLGEALAPRLGGGRSVRDVAGVTLVGSSAGGPAIANLLDGGELDALVRNVVLFDALYGAESTYARWLRGGEARKLVSLHAGTRYTGPPTERLAAALRPWLRDGLAVEPDGALTDAVRAHRAVLATVRCEHICMGLAHLDKVLLGLDLPPREPDPDPKQPTAAPPAPAAPLAIDELRRGALDLADARMRDGSHFDDHALDLARGEAVTLTLRGGATRGFLCYALDVQLRVLDGERVLADDDDGAGGLDSRVTLRAPRDGRFTVRVMAHGPWTNTGAYTLRVTR